MQSDYFASKNQQKNQLTMNLQSRRNNYFKQFAKEDRDNIIAQKRNRLNLGNNFFIEEQRFRIVDHSTINNPTINRNVLNNQVAPENQDDNRSVNSECSMSTVSSMQEEDQQNRITNEVNLNTIIEKSCKNKVHNKTQIDDIFNY